MERGERPDVVTGLLLAATALALPAALVMAFWYAPREANMGDVQRIFYFHVASAWVGFAAFAVTAVAVVCIWLEGRPLGSPGAMLGAG